MPPPKRGWSRRIGRTHSPRNRITFAGTPPTTAFSGFARYQRICPDHSIVADVTAFDAFKAAVLGGERFGLQILAQGCPVKDRAVFEATLDTLHLLNLVTNGRFTRLRPPPRV